MPDTTPQTYRIGEVAAMLNLKTYVLRFWETEFTQLAPLRTAKGQRLYTRAHVELLRRIQQLLHEQGMTIEGARRVLEGSDAPAESAPELPASVRDKAFTRMLLRELRSLRRLLEGPAHDKAVTGCRADGM